MVDTIIVGRLLGTGPLAAVGSTGSINFFIIGFCLGKMCIRDRGYPAERGSL